MKLGMAQGELESHSNPNNLVDRSPQHGKKRMRCPSEFEGSYFHPLHMSSVKRFLSHMTVCVVTCCFACFVWRCDPKRRGVGFCFLFTPFYPHDGGVDQGITLC